MAWNDIVTAKEVFNKYDRARYAQGNPIARLNTKERAHIRAEVEGVSISKYGFKKDNSIFERPRVAKALEEILEESGLSDKRLARRLRQIIFNPSGANGDNTSHNAIRTVWQIKGRFAAEKHEVLHRSDLEKLSDEQLDRIIASGLRDVRITQIKVDDGTTSGS